MKVHETQISKIKITPQKKKFSKMSIFNIFDDGLENFAHHYYPFSAM
jgi:hypothetical protein